MPKLDRQTVLCSLNCFAAAMMALYIALTLNLERPYWAVMTVYVASNPFAGAVRSKAIYRLAGTLIGAAVMVALVPSLVDSPLVLCLAMSLWVGGCLALSLLDRTPRGYLPMLAGYTAALIAFPTVDHPEAVFEVAVARVEEIGLGVICAAVVHSLVFPRSVGAQIQANLSRWMASADRWLLDLVRGESDAARDRRDLAAAASDIRILATHLPFDTSRLRDARRAVHAMHERMLLLIPLLSGLADPRRAAAESGGLAGAAQVLLEQTTAWVEAGARNEQASTLAADLRANAAAHAGGDWRDLLIESLFVHLADTVSALGACHALLEHVRAPDTPAPPEVAAVMARAAARPLHRDLGLALRSGAMCAVAVMLTCVVWIGTGWPDGAAGAAMVGVYAALFANLDDPAPGILSFGLATFQTLLLGAVYVFAIFQGIDGFPLLATVLFPPLFLFGLYVGDPSTTTRGMLLALMFGSALGLHQSAGVDAAAYLNGNLSIFVGLFIALFAAKVLRSTTPEASVRRLLRLTWTAISRLARHGAFEEPARVTALLVDRLALLTPRLARHEAASDAMADDALRDLRVAMNLMAVQAALRELDALDRARVDGVMDGLGEHYARLARGGAPIAPGSLLTRLDAALSSVAGATDAAGRGAALGLLGLRRNLFPAAAPFVAAPILAPEQTA